VANKVSSLLVVLWIGLLAGTLDITENLIFNQLRGISPKMVFQYIASGLVGRKAFHGDWDQLRSALSCTTRLHLSGRECSTWQAAEF
jgi:hypothetical protein